LLLPEEKKKRKLLAFSPFSLENCPGNTHYREIAIFALEKLAAERIGRKIFEIFRP
jgi:hypothetical protein